MTILYVRSVFKLIEDDRKIDLMLKLLISDHLNRDEIQIAIFFMIEIEALFLKISSRYDFIILWSSY